ncbi:hypothetical protein F5051DRAFT_85901 [Lentinula edodes]|nr:hypothetical protein F5051DRAFT_85901 [Lentinula edodes]
MIYFTMILLVLCGFGSAFFAVKGIKSLLYRTFAHSLAPREPDEQLPRRQHLPAASRRRLESDRLQQCPSHPDDPPNPLDTDFEPFFPHQNNNEQHPIPDASPYINPVSMTRPTPVTELMRRNISQRRVSSINDNPIGLTTADSTFLSHTALRKITNNIPNLMQVRI